MKSSLIIAQSFDVGGLETHAQGKTASVTHAGCRVRLAAGGPCTAVPVPREVASVASDGPTVLGGADRALMREVLAGTSSFL